jgi:predicted ester cyclase/catechol 2,3-dioxygenase-like lactoylglutathione lyase family enzyme
MPARHALTILAVRELERALAFYRAAFAWPQVVDTPVYAELALPGGMRFGLYQREAFARNTGRAPAALPAEEISATELYLFVEDLPAAVARIEAAGGRLLSPAAPRAWGDEAAYFADPDGNVVVAARPAALEPRAVVSRWLEAWRGGDASLLDELHAPDFVDHAPSGRAPDHEGFKEGLRALYAAFPDFLAVAEEILVAPDASPNAVKATLRWSASATHRGAFLGIAPTGRTIRFRGIEIVTLREGRIAARWGEWDGLDLLAQLERRP